jgi:hypothetical protein
MAVFCVRLLPGLQGGDLGVPKDAVEVEEQSSPPARRGEGNALGPCPELLCRSVKRPTLRP